MLSGQYAFQSLLDIGCIEEVPETSDTLEGNALQKARYVHSKYGFNCFSEDTGLEVDALDGAPGVITARYAGPQRDSSANMAKVLDGLSGKLDRRAQFRTVIALILDDKEYLFEGICRGQIANQLSGSDGFGYDPIFVPANSSLTFAEMSSTDKNAISHRGRALRKFIDFLSDQKT